MNYTVTALVAVGLAIGYDLVMARTRLVTRKAFWTAYAIVLGFQLVVNGLLTGLRVVRYRRNVILGWHVMYAPVEDLLFGFAMVLVTLVSWVWVGRRAARGPQPATRPRPPAPGAAAPR